MPLVLATVGMRFQQSGTRIGPLSFNTTALLKKIEQKRVRIVYNGIKVIAAVNMTGFVLNVYRIHYNDRNNRRKTSMTKWGL